MIHHIYSQQDRRTNRICGGLAIFGVVFVVLGISFNNDTITTLGGVYTLAALMLTRRS